MTPFRVYDPETILSGRSAEVLAYWQAKKGDAIAPAWNKTFFLEDLGWDVLPNMSVVDIVDEGRDYRYRYWGTNNAHRKGFEMTGKLLSESPLQASIGNGRTQFKEVVRQRKPLAIIYVLEYLKYTPLDQITFRFPLSSDGETIDKIVTYQDLDEKPDNWAGLFDELWQGNRPRWVKFY